MVGDPDHCLVGRCFGQRAGIHAVDFEKIQSSLYCSSFVAVKVCLALRKMVSVGCGDLVEIAISIKSTRFEVELGLIPDRVRCEGRASHPTPQVDRGESRQSGPE